MNLIAFAIFVVLGKEISAQICKPLYTRLPTGLGERCPADKPQEETELCYSECRSGYYGTGPWCWENCKSTEENDGLSCRTNPIVHNKNKYTRSGSLPRSCPSDRTMQDGMCHKRCNSGYQLHGAIGKCMKPCPSGYTDLGLTCSKTNTCCNWGVCLPCGVDVRGRDSYSIGNGIPPVYCPSGKQQSIGMCYSPCKPGYYGTGPLCTEVCSKGIDRGLYCEYQSLSMRLKDKYGRGIGVPKECDSDEDSILGICHPKCDDGYTGILAVCNADGWLGAAASGMVITPFLNKLLQGCAMDARLAGVLAAADLVGFDFDLDFDKCFVDNLLEGIGTPGWEKSSGVFALEIRVSVKIPAGLRSLMKKVGFLGKVMEAFVDIDYPNYDDFRASFSGFASEATLDSMDIFLRWLWFEIILKQRFNVYVGLAFDSSGDGLDVYFYYGSCDGKSMDVGFNQVVYRSLDDIVGKMQIHAPTVKVPAIPKVRQLAGGLLYGLDDKCSLQYVGISVGYKANLKSLTDVDGLQCIAPQIIPLIKTSSTNPKPTIAPKPTSNPAIKPIAPQDTVDDAVFSHLGCYKDTGDRAMDHLKNGIKTIEGCHDLCKENGYSLFGLQYPPSGQCFCSNDKDEAMQFGEASNCQNGRGGSWSLDIYQMAEKPAPNKWLLVLNQDVSSGDGYFASNIASTGIENKDNPKANAFSIVGGLDKNEFKIDGKYKLRLSYPKLTNGKSFDKMWTQTSWLMDAKITGSSLGEYNAAKPNELYGLGLSNHGLLDGNAKHHNWWWFAAGTINKHGGGIPAMHPVHALRARVYVCTGGDCDEDTEIVECSLDERNELICLPNEDAYVYDSGPQLALIPKQNSEPLFYLDMTDAMTFSMDVTVNSIPSGWASVFHCGSTNKVRMPGIWLHPTTDNPGAKHQGFTIVQGTISNWNQYSAKATPALYPGKTYHLEIQVTQSSFVVKMDGKITLENNAYQPHSLNLQEPCYVGDPWYIGADVVIKNLKVKNDQ